MARQSAKVPTQRQRRVAGQMRGAIAAILERDDLHDPDLSALTVTDLSVSPDLRNATVFVTRLGGGDAGQLLTALKRARSAIRHALAKEMHHLKTLPELHFREDRSFDAAERIRALLDDPHVIRDLSAPDAGDGAGREDGDGPAASR